MNMSPSSLKKTRFLAVGLLLFYLCFCVFLPVSASAQTSHTVKAAIVLQDGLAQRDAAGNLSGYSVDYLNRIAQYAGWNLEYVVVEKESLDASLAASLELVKTGQADIVCPMLYSEALSKQFSFPTHNYGMVYTMLSALKTNGDISSINYTRFSPLRVAVIANAAARRAELKSFMSSYQLPYKEILCSSTEEQQAALRNNTADVLLRVSLNYFPDTKEICRFAPRPYYFVTTSGNATLVAEIDNAISKISQYSPDFESSLYETYFGNIRSARTFELTSTEAAYFSRNHQLRVLMGANNAPYSYVGPGNVPSGVAVSLIEEFAKTAGLSVRYDTWNRLDELRALLDKTNYDILVLPKYAEQYISSRGYVVSNPYSQTSYVTFRRLDGSSQLKSSDTLAAPRGTQLPILASRPSHILYCDTVADCVKAVKQGKAAMGIGDNRAVEYAINSQFSNMLIVALAGSNSPHSLYVQHSSIILLGPLNRFIGTLTEEHTYEYFAQASSSLGRHGFKYFVYEQPLLASFLLIFCTLSVFLIVFLILRAKSSKRQNLQLQAANAAKTSFLSRISHDMRTPLNGILGLTSLMKELKKPEQFPPYLDQLELSGRYLLNLINDTLDVSKIESGKLELHPTVCDGSNLLFNTFSLIKPNLEEKKLTFHTHLPAILSVALYVDVGRTQQVLMNILSNAVKFTPEGGVIDFSIECLSKTDTLLVDKIVIRDNGIGISPEFLPHLFESFSQEHNQTTSQYQGTGLGMAITKQIVELMGGTITVESRLGEGTAFTLTLPFPLATAEQIAEAETHGEETLSHHRLAGKHILLCEDHPLNTQIATKLLESRAMVVDHAENGKIGVDLFASSAPFTYDAILMDIRMPVMDGLEATRAIRACRRPDALVIPIIAMTANAFEEDIQHSLESGMNAHLAKPVSPDLLCDTLLRLLNARS